MPRLEADAREEAFFAREPYFSVLTTSRFLRETFTAPHEQEFFASGEAFVSWLLSAIEIHFQPNYAPASVLEYGCGPGRLAMAFARRGMGVTAVDRSPAMLETARDQAARQGVTDIEWQSPSALFGARRKFDLVCCHLVLQRMDPREGLGLIHRLCQLLGAGGIGLFSFPYQDTTPQILRLVHGLRSRLPVVNGVANVLRGKTFGTFYIPTHIYDLDAVAATVAGVGVESTYLALAQQGTLAYANLFVQAPLSATRIALSGDPNAAHAPAMRSTDAATDIDPVPRAAAESAVPARDQIDVRRLMANTSLEELNRAAEAYFSSLTDRTHLLTKPFGSVDETPHLLTDVAVLLQGLRLTPGATVLEFGAGSGWLSRVLTQLGCRVWLADVSPTALKIAEDLYARLPVIGPHEPPRFLPYDGRHLDLPDESVDRVVVFHAFHHVPNVDETLRELARILKPGGIAAFAEPGPRHSHSPLSQFEMRTYGVVENDVEMRTIWQLARAAGFSDLKLALFHTLPFHVSLSEYDDLLAGGDTCARWVESTRGFLRDVRTFFLYREGAELLDSRSTNGLAARITVEDAPASGPVSIHEGAALTLAATIVNTGAAAWLPSDVGNDVQSGPVAANDDQRLRSGLGAVYLGAHIYDASGGLLRFDAVRQTLGAAPRTIAPDESIHVRMTLPSLPPGEYVIELDCVAEGVAWFSQLGSLPARVAVRIVVNEARTPA